MAELTDGQWRPIDAEIFAGRMISAIKLYREATGERLKDAKDAAEARAGYLLRDFPDRFGKQDAAGAARVLALSVAWEAIDAELLAGRKIQAVKLYREASGEGLKGAKDAIDAREKELRPLSDGSQAGARAGCMGMFLLVIGTLAVIKIFS